MYLRSDSHKTLASVIDDLETHSSTVQTLTVSPGEIHLDLTTRTMGLGSVEVPATADGIRALGTVLDVPSSFLLRQPEDLQQYLLSTLVERRSGSLTFDYTTDGVREVREPQIQVIAPTRLLRVASRVIDIDAPVIDFWSNPSEFHLDVIAPSGFDRGVGGDPKVGDLSLAGVRITQDRKHNLAPSVQPFQQRLVCTNGMTTRYDGLKVDARGASVDEVLAEFETIADLAFRKAEEDIASFYSLRSEVVANPERTLLRMAQDAGLTNRVITTLLGRVSSVDPTGPDGAFSQFDLVNLITNEANNPEIRRFGTRMALQGAGGGIVTEHAERCSACQSRLVH